jgi:hypothetical protein
MLIGLLSDIVDRVFEVPSHQTTRSGVYCAFDSTTLTHFARTRVCSVAAARAAVDSFERDTRGVAATVDGERVS